MEHIVDTTSANFVWVKNPDRGITQLSTLGLERNDIPRVIDVKSRRTGRTLRFAMVNIERDAYGGPVVIHYMGTDTVDPDRPRDIDLVVFNS